MVKVVILLAAVAGLVLCVRRRYVLVTVSGSSMEPAYRSGDRVWVKRVPAGAVRLGQVVVVRLDVPEGWALEPWSIKRVTAIGDGGLWVVGDRPDESYDSRHCGPVPGDRLLGVVVRRASDHRREAADVGEELEGA